MTVQSWKMFDTRSLSKSSPFNLVVKKRNGAVQHLHISGKVCEILNLLFRSWLKSVRKILKGLDA